MFEKLLRKIAGALKSRKIPYIIIGGQAVLVYGEPRLTKDIDVTLGIGLEQLEKVEELLQRLKLTILPKDHRAFVKDTMVLPALDKTTGIKVDFIFSSSAYEQEAIKRAKSIKIGKTPVKFASMEDVIIHKVISGRPRDIEDIKSMLAKNARCDGKYIRMWLRRFDDALDSDYYRIYKNIARK